MRRSHVIYLLKSPAKTKTQYVEKDCIDGLWHSTTPKSPRGAALTTLTCDTPCCSGVTTIEVSAAKSVLSFVVACVGPNVGTCAAIEVQYHTGKKFTYNP
jgi:hypothetical protein